jgi:CubicO group peptidase (beta-lactamase class C family)
VVVVHRGAIVYERYRAPYTADSPHATWSVAKSFLNALVGVAVREGRLELDDSICDHLRPGRELPDASCAVTVQHLLDMASGFQWRETYEGMPPTASSVLAMLYGEGAADMATFVATQPLVREPGAAWQYSSGDSNVLAAVAGAVLQEAHGERFPFAVLLDKLGMSSATWERDASGTYVGSSYLWATPRDLARFGFMALHDGCWHDEPIVPPGWMEFSTELSEAIQRDAVPKVGEIAHARLFWVNQTLPGMEHQWCPDAPPRMFAALGHWGQSITMIPEQDVVIVRVADDRDGTYAHNELVKRVLALVEAL